MDPEHYPRLTNMRPFQMGPGILDTGEDQYTSLSDYHDHEPKLEFDDSELLQPACPLEDLTPEMLEFPSEDYIESPVSDGTIEENFEELLPPIPSVVDDVEELDNTGFVEVVGDDEVGRRIIVVSACRLPDTKIIHPDRLLKYLTATLDRYVEQDYTVIYFHYGLSGRNQPSTSWLWRAFRTFDRKYKKNLKALYLVHPTNFIRIVWQLLRPAISAKFGRKMMYVNYLHELHQHVNLDQVCPPDPVVEHNKVLLAKNPKADLLAKQTCPKYSSSDGVDAEKLDSEKVAPLTTYQFGVSLQFIIEHNGNVIDSIPPIVRQCIEFLSEPDALETEGLFRRSANVTLIKDLQTLCNRGEPISFQGQPHVAAVLLKSFLRELEEPLMTFELYEEIAQFQNWQKVDKSRQVKILVLEKLPLDHYKVLKYIVQFLAKVMDRCDLNKMTCSNLAVVFGPNLVRSQNNQMSLQAIAPINAFTDFLLQHQESIFII